MEESNSKKKVDIYNIRIQTCNGITDEKLNTFYDFLLEKGVMQKYKQLIHEGNDICDLVEDMVDTLDELIEDGAYWINSIIDYCADSREIPYWMGRDRIANAIIDDLIGTIW